MHKKEAVGYSIRDRKKNKKNILMFSFFWILIFILISMGVMALNKIVYRNDPDSLQGSGVNTMNSDGSAKTTSILSSTANYDSARWSPDGTQIVFTRKYSYNQIYKMNGDGTNVFKVTDLGWDDKPVMSPDGTMIAYECGTTTYICTVNSDGTNRIQYNLGKNPRWSPDGTKIGYNDDYHIYIMNKDGTNNLRLVSGLYMDINPEWSSDGTKIVFMAKISSPSEQYEIYIINSDGTNLIRLTSNSAADEYLVLSLDGTKIVWQRAGANIYVMNSDGSNVKLLTSGSIDQSPQWSSDGTKILFRRLKSASCTNTGDGKCWTILVINSDGTGITGLTTSYSAWGPFWQPAPCTKIRYYEDIDNDGYGSANFQDLCFPSGNYKVTQSGDCNDNNANIRPGIAEVCNNGDDDIVRAGAVQKEF